MLKPTLLTLSLACLLCVSSIAQDTVWYDINWKVTNTNPYFFRTKTKTDSGWAVADHYRDGKVQMTGLYADDSLKMRQGTWRWFFRNGTVTHLQTFAEDKPDGFEQFYYDDGTPRLKGITKDKQRDGEWSVFFPSGKLAGKAVYKAGTQVSLVLFKEDGSRNTRDTIFERDSEFPGGLSKLSYFMGKNLRYPDSAVVYEIQGTVIVRFHVSKEGKVSNLIVEQSVNPYLDAEALRVIGLMRDWKPAIVAGVPVESYHLQPVAFNLQAQ